MSSCSMKIAQTSLTLGCLIKVKVKVMARLINCSSFTTIQTVNSNISALALDRKLLLSICVHLILIYNIYEYCHG